MGGNALWYKDAIIYQVHVRAFKDANNDGIGDFRGLTEKLDYLENLGITAIWLLPFYPSPLKDDGYDISDYTGIHPSYGTMKDFNRFIKEAHRRGLKVITELVINHTSDQHSWFLRARRAPKGSIERDFYVWSETTDKYKGARIIFKDFEHSNWAADSVAGAYYWHRFYSHQPDLNFDNPEVRKALFRILDLWLERGVDGLRLDAVPYLYERDGTSCENLEETHAFLKELRAHVDGKFENRMLLAEANQWPEDAVAYFGGGEECHMAFHFPIMPRMFMAIRMENRFPIVDVMLQTPQIPESAQWAMFLRNHDELTLEMVTDRERDYMYGVYARDREMRINLGIRRRLAPLLRNERRALELMKSLLFSLPGTPVIYYGDEIGMGDNVFLGDRNGVRTPMQWSPDRNAGFSRVNPQRLFMPVIIDPEYHYEAVNVEIHHNNPRSLLWWTRHIIALRKRYKAFGRGALEFLRPSNQKILAYVRCYEEECILVVANLSRFAQNAQLDLARFSGRVPLELFGESKFPPVTEEPYLLTLGPYGFYWFSLVSPERPSFEKREAVLSSITLKTSWETVFEGRTAAILKRLFTDFLLQRRWFGGKARKIESTGMINLVKVPVKEHSVFLVFLQVEYSDGFREVYTLPLTFAQDEKADLIRKENPGAILVAARLNGREGVIYDAMWNKDFTRALLMMIARRQSHQGEEGTLTAQTTDLFKPVWKNFGEIPEPRIHQAEQSNTTVFYGEKALLKLFRHLEPGVNPDFEIGRFLTEKAGFPCTSPVLGVIEYKESGREPMTVAVLYGYVENQGDAWQYTLDYLSRYYEGGVAKTAELENTKELLIPRKHILDSLDDETPALGEELLGLYLEQAELLGRRTGEFHLALASDPARPAFAPEPFTDFYRQSQYHAMRGLASQVFLFLRNRLSELPEEKTEDAKHILELEKEIVSRLQRVRKGRLTGMRIRIHGDYHLGQVLYTGKDFVLIDFEGEPARSLSERRSKTSVLRDLSGMLRSFHYASWASAFDLAESAVPTSLEEMEPWRRLWYRWTCVAFLRSYLAATEGAPFLPETQEEFRALLDAYLLEKAIYELGYELNNRPNWINIPIEGIREIVEKGP
jgi:maltose alpha-D-glucosyltransferase / alpha-amylase